MLIVVNSYTPCRRSLGEEYIGISQSVSGPDFCSYFMDFHEILYNLYYTRVSDEYQTQRNLMSPVICIQVIML